MRFLELTISTGSGGKHVELLNLDNVISFAPFSGGDVFCLAKLVNGDKIIIIITFDELRTKIRNACI